MSTKDDFLAMPCVTTEQIIRMRKFAADAITASEAKAGAAMSLAQPVAPEGWRFYTVDASREGHRCSAMLIRDANGCKWWHSLDEEARESTDLYISGFGATIFDAINDACVKAIVSNETGLPSPDVAGSPPDLSITDSAINCCISEAGIEYCGDGVFRATPDDFRRFIRAVRLRFKM